MRTVRQLQGIWICVLGLLLICPPHDLEAQLPSPAQDAARELLDVVRSGDRDRIREFLETRFVPEFLEVAPLDHHVPIFASLGRQVEGLEPGDVHLDGPTRASIMLEGPGNRLELRVSVDAAPPHKIKGVSLREAGPEIMATSLDDLGREFERMANRPPFSGVVLVGSDGEIRFHEAYGSADLAAGRLNRLDTPFDIGSLNKLFTSVVILRLAQEDRINLDDPVGTFLGGFGPVVSERVTVRHLLQHRSGLGDYLSHPRFEADPKRFRAPEDYLPLARAQELSFEPGKRQAYSNMGFVVLGAIIEEITGLAYHDVVKEMVFGPAGMTSAGATAGTSAARRYELTGGRFVSTDTIYPDVGTPAGGGFAAAIDLFGFVEALLDHRLLDQEHTMLLLNAFQPGPQEGDPSDEFAFAGGAPGVNAYLHVRPLKRKVVIVLANIDPINVDAVARQIEGLSR